MLLCGLFCTCTRHSYSYDQRCTQQLSEGGERKKRAEMLKLKAKISQIFLNLQKRSSPKLKVTFFSKAEGKKFRRFSLISKIKKNLYFFYSGRELLSCSIDLTDPFNNNTFKRGRVICFFS